MVLEALGCFTYFLSSPHDEIDRIQDAFSHGDYRRGASSYGETTA
jgi:hypothetical protein